MEKADLIERAYKLNIQGSVAANKVIIEQLGVEAAILFGELLSRYKYFSDRGWLDRSGYFYNSREQLKAATGLGRSTQDKVLPKLVDIGLLDIKLVNGKAKRFKVNFEAAIELLEKEAEEDNPDEFQPGEDNPDELQPGSRTESSLPEGGTRTESSPPPGRNPATNNSFNNLIINNNKEIHNSDIVTPSYIKENFKTIKEIISA
jgi:hypothetical protein